MEKTNFIKKVILSNPDFSESYLENLPVIKHLKENSIELNSKISFFVGENGTGKSTLLEAIAIAYGFNAEGGTKNFRFSTQNTHSELFEHITLVKNGLSTVGMGGRKPVVSRADKPNWWKNRRVEFILDK